MILFLTKLDIFLHPPVISVVNETNTSGRTILMFKRIIVGFSVLLASKISSLCKDLELSNRKFGLSCMQELAYKERVLELLVDFSVIL